MSPGTNPDLFPARANTRRPAIMVKALFVGLNDLEPKIP